MKKEKGLIKSHQHFDLQGKKIFEKLVLEPPFRYFNSMTNEACFYYMVSGETETYTQQGNVSTKTNEGLVLHCGNYLSDFMSSENAAHCEGVAVHFYPEILKAIYDKDLPDFILELDQISPVTYEPVKSSELLKNYIDSLQFYFNNTEMVSDELIRLKLKELILLLAKTDNSESIKGVIKSLFSETEVKFKEVIDSNLYNDLSLEELATLCQLSLSSFKREFSKQYNMSPAKYIKKKRLERASKLLKTTDLRVSEVARDSGFNSLAHFSRVFVDEFRISPSDYRVSEVTN